MRTNRVQLQCTILAVIAACALPSIARAQQDRIAVRLDAPQQVYVGDPNELDIVITGSKNVDAPDLSSLRDFDVTYRGPQDSSMQSMTIINGRVQSSVSITYAHVYSITARHAGQLEIPAIPVIVDGKPYLTRPATVEAVEPKQGEGFKLELLSDHATAFVGEPITVQMVWTLPQQVRVSNLLFSLPIEGAAHDLMPGPITRSLSQNDGRSIVVPLNGVQVLALHDNTVTIDRTIIPSEPGDIVVGDARADFLLEVGRRAPSMNDFFPFGSQAVTERRFSSASSLTIHVEPLPTAGRPADFSGLVGSYNISATVDAKDVSVGDPINLTVAVTGPYPLSLVPALDLARQSSLKKNFRVPREPILAQTNSGAAIFPAMIRARSAKVTQVDPISLNFFDPKMGEYRTIQTGAIPISVKASNTITLPDEPEADSAPPPPQEHRPGGLPDIDRSQVSAGAAPLDLRREVRSPAVIAMLAAPPALCLLAYSVIGVRSWRRRDPAARRRHAALRHLRKTLRRGKNAPVEAAAAGLCNFAADWFDQPRDTLTAPGAGEFYAGTGTLAGAQLREFLATCDARRFGGPMAQSVDPAALDLSERALSLAHEFIRQARTPPKGAGA